MNLLIAIGAVFALLTVFFLARSVRCTRRGRLLRAGGAGITGIGTAIVATAAVMLAMTYLSYERLTAEQRVSTVTFRQTAPHEFQARLMIEGEADRTFALRGDEWQMDARIVTWKPPVTILGLDPVYRLERLSGRYTDIGREQNEPRTVHALSEGSAFDVWAVARRFPALTPGIDAYYGTATYVPMADGARFEVSLSRDALIARPVNPAARAAVGRWSDR
ncbi:MAG: cation/multidrug efflux pump [Woeseiaceae bacterium]